MLSARETTALDNILRIALNAKPHEQDVIAGMLVGFMAHKAMDEIVANERKQAKESDA